MTRLNQNYPNPFNPTTSISYELSASSHGTLRIYDVIGKEVATLVDEGKTAGVYTVTWDASHLSSGVYLRKLQVGNFRDIRKLILMK